MIVAYRLLLLGIAFASCLGAEAGRVGTVIEFPNTPVQAKPAHLLGYLARPDLGLFAVLGSRANSTGPYPAIVVLHGCSGFSSHNTKIADQLASWGMWPSPSTASVRVASTAVAAAKPARPGVRCLRRVALSVAA
jgi:hypothetical protein